MIKMFVVASLMCYTVYAKPNAILHLQNQAPRPTRLAVYDLLVIHVVLQSVQGFSEAVCRLPATAEQYAHLWLTCHSTQTQVAIFARGLCVIDGPPKICKRYTGCLDYILFRERATHTDRYHRKPVLLCRAKRLTSNEANYQEEMKRIQQALILPH